MPEELIEKYKKGTAPSETFTQEEFEEVKELLAGLPNTLEEDYKEGIFKPKVGGSFSIDQLAEAHDQLESRKTIGKIVVNW